MELRDAKVKAAGLFEQLSPACEVIAIAGSIRRGHPTPRDIEIVAIPKFRTRQTTLFDGAGDAGNADNLLWEALDAMDLTKIKGADKYRKFIDNNDGVQLDVFTATQDNWGLQYLIRTGSADFSRSILTIANRRGYHSEEAVFYDKRGQPHYMRSERDVFEFLGLAWIPPEKRESGVRL